MYLLLVTYYCVVVLDTCASFGMVDRTKLHVTTSWDSFSMAMCSAFDSTKVAPSTPLSFCLATRRLNRDRSSAVTLSVSKLFWQKKKKSIGRAVSDFFFARATLVQAPDRAR